MYMSGLTAFPREHWQTLGPAMKRHAEMHAKVAGHTPRGPLKHFWGEASRYVGNDDPFSLFLALGIPFEVIDQPSADGVAFLSDADAWASDQLPSSGMILVARPQARVAGRVRVLPQSMPELLAFKQELLSKIGQTPYVEGESPAVCAWYPTARAVLLWNLESQRRSFVLRYGETKRSVEIDGLDLALIENVGGAA
jgi:hypothetical protein